MQGYKKAMTIKGAVKKVQNPQNCDNSSSAAGSFVENNSPSNSNSNTVQSSFGNFVFG